MNLCFFYEAIEWFFNGRSTVYVHFIELKRKNLLMFSIDLNVGKLTKELKRIINN